ncbi:hypothetical protein ASE01_13470 [Nocardioides sp. Root190]|uniref:SDR family NAD(P)-dependent oxidoreductase n=1 Tax=Nocardioides sp. Root190 TaxID=1736488 RepID=UPI0006FEA70F|nr:SDR family oxidoreductase [Nocardioides sp. Root190]KRB76040.1 hypothetical protein ASE01_13470 [Nocardioides sp. Root190]
MSAGDPRRLDPASLFGLDGRVALVTGAAGYLGSAVASALAAAGATVVLNGRNREALDGVAGDIAVAGGAAHVAAYDLLDSAQVGALVAEVEERFGRLDVVVNNAYRGTTGTLDTATPGDYDHSFRIGMTAPADLVGQALDLLARSSDATHAASVINVASMYGVVSPDPAVYGDSGHNSAPYYGAAKAALLQWTRYAAVHLAPRHVRVNAITPGPFPKPAVQQNMPELWDNLTAKVPMGRLGTPRELCGAVVYLASDAASFVTGTNLVVDGGWTAW